MGFSLELFFEEMQFILAKDQKAEKTIKELEMVVAEAKEYAKRCGQI